MYNYSYGHHMGFAPFEFIGHVLLFAFIIFVILLVVRRMRHGRHHHHWMWGTHSALTILSERYAKGEINKEEYEERKKTLLG